MHTEAAVMQHFMAVPRRIVYHDMEQDSRQALPQRKLLKHGRRAETRGLPCACVQSLPLVLWLCLLAPCRSPSLAWLLKSH